MSGRFAFYEKLIAKDAVRPLLPCQRVPRSRALERPLLLRECCD